jgi:hypothetical protein
MLMEMELEMDCQPELALPWVREKVEGLAMKSVLASDSALLKAPGKEKVKAQVSVILPK